MFAPRFVAPLLLCAAPAAAFDGQFAPIEGGQWDVDDGPVPYVLEPNGSDDIDDGSDLDAVRDSFRAWECVQGTKLRFEEQEGPGPANADLEDGQNTIFWDETNEFGLGASTLGVTIGDLNGPRVSADIIMNGFDSAWSTDDRPSATDVASIAVHEIGHFLGLGHPCDEAGGQETNCNGPERSVMTPIWDGQIGRLPLADDEAGVVALYPGGEDDGGCDGPSRIGERCTCDGECVEGLVCASIAGGNGTCAKTCAADASDCGNGFACVLDPPQDGDVAQGVCVRAGAGEKPAGAVCVNGGECAEERACSLLFELARSLCAEPCDAEADCAVGTCFEGFCLGGASHEACEEPEEGCTCATSTGSSSSSVRSAVPAACALLALAALSRRRSRGAVRRGAGRGRADGGA